MAKIKFEKGDAFSYLGGYGVVMSDAKGAGDTQEVLLFKKGEVKDGWSFEKAKLPDKATLVPNKNVCPYELRLAMAAVVAATK